MATKVPVKSILKQQSKPAATTPSDEQKAKTEKDRHNLNIALQHAYLIQNQKDVQAQILSSIESLLDFPSTSSPTTQEASRFTNLVSQFQPSDLDALVEERRIDGRCGYALCRCTPRSQTMGDSASWKLGKNAADFCSSSCARKSMYIKTQLSEVPTWERDPTIPVRIQLHEDDRSPTSAGTDGARQRQQQVANDEELALERGEKAASFRPKQVMTDRIVEKRNVTHKPMSGLSSAAVSHTAIEGYEPRVKAKGGKRDNSDDSDEDEEVSLNDDDDDAENDEGLFDNIDSRGVSARAASSTTGGQVWETRNWKEDGPEYPD